MKGNQLILVAFLILTNIIMETTKEEIVRTTEITLNNDEFVDAIRLYLKSKGIKDTDQYVTINPIYTQGDEGLICKVTIKNMNKDNNLYKELK